MESTLVKWCYLDIPSEVKGVTGPSHVSVECVFHFLGDRGTRTELKDSSHLVSDSFEASRGSAERQLENKQKNWAQLTPGRK